MPDPILRLRDDAHFLPYIFPGGNVDNPTKSLLLSDCGASTWEMEWRSSDRSKGGFMAEVILFHHAMGQSAGFHDFARQLREAGHTVHTPDLFEGRRFTSIEDGLAFVEALGFPEQIVERADQAVASLPHEVVYAGFSVGVVSAQRLAQTRQGAKGALLFYSCIPLEFFGGSWPSGVPVQIHAMDADPFFVNEGDLEAARQLVESTDQAELFLYPGDQHYFADSSLPSFRPEAAALLVERVRAFLDQVSP